MMSEKLTISKLRDDCLKHTGMIECIRYQIDLLEDIEIDNMDEDNWDKTISVASSALFKGQQVLADKISYYDLVLASDTDLGEKNDNGK